MDGCVMAMHGVRDIHTLVVKTVTFVVFLVLILAQWELQDGKLDTEVATVTIHIQDQDSRQ